MKNLYTLSMCALLLSLFASSSYAQQREMIIEPMQAADVIRDFVNADLAATDSATVATTKYILRRDAIYPFSEEWRPTHPLHLEAEEGDGERPVMLAIVAASGQAPSFCRVLNSFTWRGLSLPGLDAAGDHTDNAPFRPRGDGITCIGEDCLIENQRLDVVRMDGSNQKLHFTNNIIRNAYQRDLWNKGGGGLFMRGNKQDTVIWNHNTFFNTPCVVGYSNDGGGEGVDYLEFRNNTIVNAGGLQQPAQFNGIARHAAINLGVPEVAIVEDNIFQNVGYMGIDSQFADFHFQYLIRLTDSTQMVSFRNNNIFTDEALDNVAIPDTAIATPMWNPEMDSVLAMVEAGGTPSFTFIYENNISEMLAFTNPATQVDEAVRVKTLYWSDPANVIFNLLEIDLSKDVYELDYAYPTDATSYTAGTNGGPLGSARWFGGTVTNVEYAAQSEFVVHGNYPNPFAQTTTIGFDLKEAAQVQVLVFDLQGKVVLSTPKVRYVAGENHQIELHRTNLSAGMYPYSVISTMGANTIETSRIMVVK